VNPYIFPHPEIGERNGMTLRDYYAGQAMIALIPIHTSEKSSTEHYDFEYEVVANEAYNLADAMLSARIAPC
jgi:hypothetical protein